LPSSHHSIFSSASPSHVVRSLRGGPPRCAWPADPALQPARGRGRQALRAGGGRVLPCSRSGVSRCVAALQPFLDILRGNGWRGSTQRLKPRPLQAFCRRLSAFCRSPRGGARLAGLPVSSVATLPRRSRATWARPTLVFTRPSAATAISAEGLVGKRGVVEDSARPKNRQGG
jgi:hypothetical protein